MTESEESQCVTQLDTNRISFTGEINNKTVSKLIAAIIDCIKHQPLDIKQTIYLHVQSNGGCLTSGLRAYDNIKHLSAKCNIVTVAEGFVASAATLIFLAGSERHSFKNTWFLFHQLSTCINGKNSDVQDEATNCKLMMRQLIRIYTNETTLKRTEIKRLLLKEVNVSAKQAKKWGVLSTIL